MIGYVFFENGLSLRITEHFSLSEFRCKKNFADCPYCQGTIRTKNLSKIFQAAWNLEDLRNRLYFQERVEVEVLITSASRCRERNAELSTVVPPENSWHWKGLAVDVVARKKESGKMVKTNTVGFFAQKIFGEEFVVIEEKCVHIRFPGV